LKPVFDHACRVLVADSACVQYPAKRPDDAAVRAPLKDLLPSVGALAIGGCGMTSASQGVLPTAKPQQHFQRKLPRAAGDRSTPAYG